MDQSPMKDDAPDGQRPVMTDINVTEVGNPAFDHLRIPAKYKWTALCFVVALPIGHTWTGSALGPLKNTLREELDISNTQFGVISSADAFVNTIFPIVGGLILDWWGPNIVTLFCTSFILVGSVVAAVGVQIGLWRLLVSGHVLMGFGIAVLDSATQKFFYHWFGASGLALAFGLESAISSTVGLVSGMVAIPIRDRTGWYGWTFWIPVVFCGLSLAMNISYVCFERFVVPTKYRLTPGRDAAIIEKHLTIKRNFSWELLLTLPWAYLMLPATQLLQSGAAGGFNTSSADIIFLKGYTEEVAGYLSTAQRILPIVLSPALGLMDVIFGVLQDGTEDNGYYKVLLVAIGIKAWAFVLGVSYIIVDYKLLGKGMTMTRVQREAKEAVIEDCDADPLTRRRSKPWFTALTFGLLVAIIASAWAVFLKYLI
ncbi:uncharacterized protein LW94_14180 [Fusarium fujikuroi]|nr:uncharacterized protein LW94_14180 [Fusarium fujikuroi]